MSSKKKINAMLFEQMNERIHLMDVVIKNQQREIDRLITMIDGLSDVKANLVNLANIRNSTNIGEIRENVESQPRREESLTREFQESPECLKLRDGESPIHVKKIEPLDMNLDLNLGEPLNLDLGEHLKLNLEEPLKNKIGGGQVREVSQCLQFYENDSLSGVRRYAII